MAGRTEIGDDASGPNWDQRRRKSQFAEHLPEVRLGGVSPEKLHFDVEMRHGRAQRASSS